MYTTLHKHFMTTEQIQGLLTQVKTAQEFNALRNLSARNVLDSIPVSTIIEMYQPQQNTSLGFSWLQVLEQHFRSQIVVVDKANMYSSTATGKVLERLKSGTLTKLAKSIIIDGVTYYPVNVAVLVKPQAANVMDFCPLNPELKLQDGIGTKGLNFTGVSEKVRHILHCAVCWKKSFSIDAFGVATQIKNLLKASEDQIIDMLETESADAYAMYLDDCRSAISYARRLELWQQMELAKKVPEKPAVSTGQLRDGKRFRHSSNYELLIEKRDRMARQRILETRVDEKFRLDQMISECQAEINALEKAETEE